jgi:hypothetical protein
MNVQNREIYSGENRTLSFAARDGDNAVASLTSKTVTYRVAERGSDVPIFSKTGSVVSAAAGTFTVAITPDDTQDMAGDYAHQAITTDGSGNIAVVVVGRLRVRPEIEA